MASTTTVTESAAAKGNVTLSGSVETLLITLIARAQDAQSASPILNDQHSLETVARIRAQGYDFSRTTLDKAPGMYTRLVATRCRILDRCCEAFLARNPGPATVIHLACGMDARERRIAWQGDGRLWIDVDLPDVVALRRQVIDPPSTARGGEYRLLNPDIIHDDQWLQKCNVPSDRPIFVMFEGLTPYLTGDEVHGLLGGIVNHFRHSGVGGEIRFDTLGSVSYFLINYVFNRHLTSVGAKFQWYMDDPRTLEKHVPGLRYKERMFNMIDFATYGRSGMLVRALMRIADWFNLAGPMGSGYGYEF